MLFAIGEAGKGPLAIGSRPPSWARPVWISGALLAIVHSVIAFAVRYHWNHEAAVQATAMQAAGLYGFAWRGSLYVNYVFLTMWLVAWSWHHWAWRAFVLTMIVNGAVVFARPMARPFGVVLVAALVWAWWPRTSRVARAR